MEASELESGIDALEQLSQTEYRQGLSTILARPGTEQGESLLRVGRLIGVELKKPFATSRTTAEPSEFSGAYREWIVKSSEQLDEASLSQTWQYQVVDRLRHEESTEGTWVPETTLEFVQYVPTERGFFGYLARSFRRYICQDPTLAGQVAANIEGARRVGLDILDPKTAVAATGAALGTLLVQSSPVFGVIGVSGIAGIVLVLYSVGLDAFCDWAKSVADARGSEDLGVALPPTPHDESA